MARIAATTYNKPAAPEKVNPFIEDLRPFADQGVDTAFSVETTADEYKADKLLIQKAMNAHGFSAREVETTWDDELSGDSSVTSTFIVRPRRKRKGEQEETDSAE